MDYTKSPMDASLQTLIERRFAYMLSPLEWFVRKQSAASILLLFATLLALAFANSPWAYVIPSITEMKIAFSFHEWSFAFSIKGLVNDGLLSLFFLLLGLEIKREILTGHLSHPKKITLIIFAASGGMIVPALIYFALNTGEAGQVGWAIPMATDTALAIGVLALLARYVSIGVSIFLAALAIFDDIGAILVIAIFYTDNIDGHALLLAFIPYFLLGCLNIAGVRRSWPYIMLGIVFWAYIHASGIHATLAGLLMALAIPARSRISQRTFITLMRQQILMFEKDRNVDGNILKSPEQNLQMTNMGATVHAASTPLQRWYNILGNPIAIIVLPLFAISNAGVHLSAETISIALSSPGRGSCIIPPCQWVFACTIGF